MRFHLGVEDIEPGNWVVWVFELPGCYARGHDLDAATASVERCIREHIGRLHSLGLWSGPAAASIDFTFEITERHTGIMSDTGDYIVNAFFEADRAPLNMDEVSTGQSLALLNRVELISAIRPLDTHGLDQPIEGEQRGCIREILRHIATTEWWYFDRIDRGFERARWRRDVFELLQQVREHTNRELPRLAGEDTITEKRQERWSPRKVLRRLIWHEHVHTKQIQQYMTQLSVKL